MRGLRKSQREGARRRASTSDHAGGVEFDHRRAVGQPIAEAEQEDVSAAADDGRDSALPVGGDAEHAPERRRCFDQSRRDVHGWSGAGCGDGESVSAAGRAKTGGEVAGRSVNTKGLRAVAGVVSGAVTAWRAMCGIGTSGSGATGRAGRTCVMAVGGLTQDPENHPATKPSATSVPARRCESVRIALQHSIGRPRPATTTSCHRVHCGIIRRARCSRQTAGRTDGSFGRRDRPGAVSLLPPSRKTSR